MHSQLSIAREGGVDVVSEGQSSHTVLSEPEKNERYRVCVREQERKRVRKRVRDKERHNEREREGGVDVVSEGQKAHSSLSAP